MPFSRAKLALERHKSCSGLAIYYDRVLSITTRVDHLLCLELVAYYDGEEVVKPFDLNSFSYAKRNYGMIKMC